MWPKLLFDLLPHFTRLMPMADKYLSTRAANDKAQQAALKALAADVRGEVGKATEANADLRRQMQEQTSQIANLAVDVTRARMSVESVEARFAKLEKSLIATERSARVAVRLLVAVLGLLVTAFALLLVLTVRGAH